jgi:mRNA-degrading endonuclease YafQ of YafQ-DinJ toxin-antitoxin module
MEIEKPFDFTPFSDNDLDDILRLLLDKKAFYKTNNDHRFIEDLQPIPDEHAKTLIILHKLYADKMIIGGTSSQTDYKYIKNGHRGSDTVYTLEYTRRWKDYTPNGHFALTPKGYNCITSGGYVSKTRKKNIKNKKETSLFIATIITAIATAITALYVINPTTTISNNQNYITPKSNIIQLDTTIKKIKIPTEHKQKKLP